MFTNKAGDKKVTVIVTFTILNVGGNISLFAGLYQQLRFQLFRQKIITASLIHFQRGNGCTELDEFNAIERLPSRPVSAQIVAQGLFAPGAFSRGENVRKRRRRENGRDT